MIKICRNDLFTNEKHSKQILPASNLLLYRINSVDIHFHFCVLRFFNFINENSDLKETEDYLSFENCYFYKATDIIDIENVKLKIEFYNCHFLSKNLKIASISCNVKLLYCVINHLYCGNTDIGNEENNKGGKLKLYTCEIYEVNFRGTTFHNLINFFQSTFHKPVTFHKTKFFGIVVFSAVTFKENVLFSYTVVKDLMLLRGAFAEKGFDISLAIIKGSLSLFKLRINNFKTYTSIYKDVNAIYKKDSYTYSFTRAYEQVYENAVSKNHLIPIENKRETYRILKYHLESQKNFIAAVHYKRLESKTLLLESWLKFKHGNFLDSIANLGILSLNAISNWFGSSYIQGVLFTVLIGGLFFSLSLFHVESSEFITYYDKWQWEYFVQFLNPTHRFDYIKAIDENPQTWFFIWDFIGRIFVGYGIYQTIQAFRKYK
ncbi:pentapeptide repeat-containing protein [Kordia jejudonensis]|uniref:pentapeptide repeat-containing protein n=1 Tax=Kordia jejudonensis TaxID=1348245 RepID=UPI0012E0BAF4|nr:pentapeptide repeat-containing protein [Kordia jejudonensis]